MYRAYKNLSDLGAKMSLQQAQKKHNQMMVKSMTMHKGNSKAIAANFAYKAGHADNFANRAIVHHGYGGGGGGAHFTMAASKQFNKGVRVKGVVSRKAGGGTKMQAAQKARNKSNRGNGSMAVMK